MSSAGKVLVVDDDPDFVEYTRIVLESQGYEVRTAATAEQALRMMRQEKPDVALLDVMMSYVLDGLNLTRQMRDDPELRDIPVIMISAIVSREEAGVFPTDEYLAVDAFMTKPVDPADLLQQVAALIQRRKGGETSKGGKCNH
ncbi:MAG: response regulator [Chloroflexi bacterium]|nr:response regulator [Chloroflexota bacterium]